MLQEKMGKNKSKGKKQQPFKVAGPRSQKAKSKAQKVKTTLKKVSVAGIISEEIIFQVS